MGFSGLAEAVPDQGDLSLCGIARSGAGAKVEAEFSRSPLNNGQRRRSAKHAKPCAGGGARI
jgi:hypothetical protein